MDYYDKGLGGNTRIYMPHGIVRISTDHYSRGLNNPSKNYTLEWKRAAIKSAKMSTNGLGLPSLMVGIPTISGMKYCNVCMPVPEIGFSWSDIKRGAGQIGKAAKNTLKQADKILSSPEAAKIMKLAAVIAPEAAMGFEMAKTATRLLDSATKGSKTAKQKIAEIATTASSGNEDAERLMQLLQAMTLARKEDQTQSVKKVYDAAVSGDKRAKLDCLGLAVRASHGDHRAKACLQTMAKCHARRKSGEVSGLEIGSWLFNKPYRSSIQAKELDSTNPKHIQRAMYYKGMEFRYSK